MTATNSNPRQWKSLAAHAIDFDEPIHWGCSGRGWHCCTDKVIPVRPYEVIRLRHAMRQSGRDLLNSGLVTFVWDAAGTLVSYLRQVPYERTRKACVFYEEVTNIDARRIREEAPERFAGLPEQVQRAADSDARGEFRVAGLCNAHQHRPEACRGFPFQRDPARERNPEDASGLQVFRCGTCALSTPTTPRAVMLDNDLEEFWRADDAFLAVSRYLQSRGLARVVHADYRSLHLTDEQRTELWASMYVPEAVPEVIERFPEQWLAPMDLEGDREIYRLVLEALLDRVDALVAERGTGPADLGPRDRAPVSRPDLASMLDPARALLPVVRATEAA
ncbi:MAG: hypothetical protein GEU80_16990 [Dehalococcoidia bacterium]|nr:hypothetical protein [Dehalococcoidia bacterium]